MFNRKQADSVHNYPQLSVAKYSLIQLSELEIEKLAQGLTWQHSIWTWDFLVECPKVYPLQHCIS